MHREFTHTYIFLYQTIKQSMQRKIQSREDDPGTIYIYIDIEGIRVVGVYGWTIMRRYKTKE